MSKLDAKWAVPSAYDPDLDFGGKVLRQRGTPTVPALQLLSYLALEEQLAALGPGSLLAWQLLADDDASASSIVNALLDDPHGDRLWSAHTMQLVAESAQRAGEVAKLAWQAPLEAADKVAAGLMLATSVAASSPEKARQFLPKIEPGLGDATPAQRATYALLRAATEPQAALLDDAHAQFAAIEHHFGLAQAALVAFQYEAAGSRDPDLLRGYLEHAVYRYDIGRRESWAARLIVYGLIPLLHDTVRANDDVITEWLQRAASFATGSRSMVELAGVFRLARKLGFDATVTTLEAGDPPQFTRVGPARHSQPVIAPVAKEASPAPKEASPAPKEASPAKPKKKRSKAK
jgi:hypothetical protein